MNVDLSVKIFPDGSITEVNRAVVRQKVEALGRFMATLEQTPIPLTHYFAPGIYMREVFMPAGTVVIGRRHKTKHLNLIERGACYYVDDDMKRHDLIAPCVFVSEGGAQKVLYITEDCVWRTIHANPSDEMDVEVLLEQLTEAPSVEPHAVKKIEVFA